MPRCEAETLTLCDRGICPHSVFSEAVPGGGVDLGDGRAAGRDLPEPTSRSSPLARPWWPQWTCRPPPRREQAHPYPACGPVPAGGSPSRPGTERVPWRSSLGVAPAGRVRQARPARGLSEARPQGLRFLQHDKGRTVHRQGCV